MAELVLSRPGVSNTAEKHWSKTLPLGVGYLAASARARGINVVVVDGTKCLLLSSKIAMGKAVVPMPPGMAVEKANMSAAFSGEFPVDTSIRLLSEKKKRTMEILAKGKMDPDGPEVTLSIKMAQSDQVKHSPLK